MNYKMQLLNFIGKLNEDGCKLLTQILKDDIVDQSKEILDYHWEFEGDVKTEKLKKVIKLLNEIEYKDEE